MGSPRLLKELSINDVSSVDVGAGRGVRVMLMKSTNHEGKNMANLTIENIRKGAADGVISRATVGALLEAAVAERGVSLLKLHEQRDPFVCGLLILDDEMGRLTGFSEPDHYVAKAGIDINGAGGLPPTNRAPPTNSRAGTSYEVDDEDFVQQPTLFEDLQIPTPGLVLGACCLPDHAAALGKLVDAHQEANKNAIPKMSRSKSYHAIMRTARGAATATKAIGQGQSGYRTRQQRTHGIGVGSNLQPDLSRRTR